MKLLIDTEELMSQRFRLLLNPVLAELELHKEKSSNLPVGFREVKKLGRKEKDLYVSK